jgi:hypothetical protein
VSIVFGVDINRDGKGYGHTLAESLKPLKLMKRPIEASLNPRFIPGENREKLCPVSEPVS